MSGMMQRLFVAAYRQAARLAARGLAAGGLTESILLHRSVGTGEVSFGRSDIDLMLVLREEVVEDGDRLAALYNTVRWLRYVIPVLGHIDVHEPGDILDLARIDTFWGSMERRTDILLSGKPVAIPTVPVEPAHAVSKFGFWLEWFFPISVQRRNRRNLRKTALESWNAYATAEGVLSEPYLLRSAMEAHVLEVEPHIEPRHLEQPAYATRFVFSLADRLHRARLPALRALSKPLLFEAITVPLSLPRLFVVVPQADTPLPPEAFTPGAWTCTPETLHLYLHYTNAFLYWVLPPELRNLGMKPPGIAGFLRACRYYGHSRFLYVSGFADPRPRTPAARLAFIRHALDWIARGAVPPAIPQETIRAMQTFVSSCQAYYRTMYASLHRESRQLQDALTELTATGPAMRASEDPPFLSN